MSTFQSVVDAMSNTSLTLTQIEKLGPSVMRELGLIHNYFRLLNGQLEGREMMDILGEQPPTIISITDFVKKNCDEPVKTPDAELEVEREALPLEGVESARPTMPLAEETPDTDPGKTEPDESDVWHGPPADEADRQNAAECAPPARQPETNAAPQVTAKATGRKLKWPSERVISELTDLHRSDGLSGCGYMMRYHGPLYYAAVGRFGSYRKAVEAAGIDYATVRQDRGAKKKR